MTLYLLIYVFSLLIYIFSYEKYLKDFSEMYEKMLKDAMSIMAMTLINNFD